MRRLGGSSLGEEGGVRRCCWGVKKERKWFCLQFGHPGSVEAHRHTGGASSVTHLPQHPTPLLLIILIPNKKRRVRPGGKHSGNPPKHVNLGPLLEETYCQTSVTSVGATSLFSVSTMAKPPTAYREPPLLNRLMELLSWGNSVKGSHLRRNSIRRRSNGRWSSYYFQGFF